MLIEELKKIRKELLERIEGQKKALDYFDKLIATLESADSDLWKKELEITWDPLPIVPKWVPHEEPVVPYEPTGYGDCSKCGLSLKYMTNYYCPRNDCPTFVKATC